MAAISRVAWAVVASAAIYGCASQTNQVNESKPQASSTTPRTFKNPILPGCYPDPAIVRVGEDYYEVNSTFEYYPGIPVFHSKDLVNWRQIGYALDRPSQLPLDKIKASAGVFAPTIQYHNGTFYICNLMVDSIGTFIVTTTNPAGPWSEPHIVKGVTGIDPALFFDDDGTAWYVANEAPADGGTYKDEHEIWIQRIDLTTFELIGEKTIIERGGAVKNAVWSEGPHLYKINGYYYLMISEAGTAEEHAISISRSKTITGPYELDKRNPIFTHRSLGKDFPIQCAGHGDLVQTQNGEWWMVCLATRPYGGGMDYNMGRETFLAPVEWQGGWPIICANVGHLQFTERAPNLPEHKWEQKPARDTFDETILGMEWNFLRTPRSKWYSLTERPGWLRLNVRLEQCTELANPSWIGRRQQHINFAASARMEFTPTAENESAGLTALLNDRNQYRLVEAISRGNLVVQAIKRENGKDTLLGEQPVSAGPLELKITATGQSYAFSFRQGLSPWKIVADNAEGRILNARASWGFTGVMLGMYATSAGKPSGNRADFDWFEYRGSDDAAS